MKSFPFSKHKVPVTHSTYDVKEMLHQYKDYYFCLYLAYKDASEWDISTSRTYMNHVLPNLIYLPVNIKKENSEELRKMYQLAEESAQIVAINQTKPHKSNIALKDFFAHSENMPTNVDAMVKNAKGKLILYDLNGPSFCNWYIDEVGSFTNKVVILVGVGGVGEPIARKIVNYQPSILYLVNPSPKEQLQKELSESGNVIYSPSVANIMNVQIEGEIVLINAAGKEGIKDEGGVKPLLEKYQNKLYVFVDLRPHLNIDIVKIAEQLGWQSYTGYGMNAWNDYTLLKKIAEAVNSPIPSFEEFKRLVKQAS